MGFDMCEFCGLESKADAVRSVINRHIDLQLRSQLQSGAITQERILSSTGGWWNIENSFCQPHLMRNDKREFLTLMRSTERSELLGIQRR